MIQRSKMGNFNRTETGLTSNGVEMRQQFKGAIRTSLTAPYDDVQRHLKFVTDIPSHIHTL